MDATFITQTPNATLSNEQALSALGTGALKSTTGTGVISLAALDDLTDAVIASLVGGQSLEYDATAGVFRNIRRFVSAPPTGAIGESMDRGLANADVNILATGRLELQPIYLVRGATITSITFVTAATAISGATHQYFGIFDDPFGTTSGTARALLRSSVDDTSAAWAINTAKTLALSSTYTPTRSGFFYFGILIVATTVPVLVGSPPGNGRTGAMSLGPMLAGFANTGLTALPDPASAPTARSQIPYFYYS